MTVIIYDYKEPLRENTNGFGYIGCVSGTEDGAKIQCHICGELKENLNQHILVFHKMPLNEYKDTFGIARTTKLISPQYKQKRVDAFNGRFTKEQQEQGRKNGIAKIQQMMLDGWKPEKNTKYRLETRNKRGTCDDQILAKIKETKKLLGHTPTEAELSEIAGNTYAHAIRRAFGSYGMAVKLAGLEMARRGKKFKHLTNEELLARLRIFTEENNRQPSTSDCGHGGLPTVGVYKRRFGSFIDAKAMILTKL